MVSRDGDITEAIEQLRSQLTAVQEGSLGERLRFAVAEVEMEFLVEVTKAGGGSGGVRLGLVSLGADGKMSSGNSHRLKLRLHVRDTKSDGDGGGDGEAVVSDRR